ncbi:MAG: type II secretion system F family protein [Ktedonobacterales bacterium]
MLQGLQGMLQGLQGMLHALLPLLAPFLAPLAGFFVFFAILLMLLGLSARRKPNSIEERLRQATTPITNIDDLEMQAPFIERFARPALAQIARALGRFTPSSVQETTQQKLVYAGVQKRMQASEFIGLRALTTIAGVVVGALMGFTLQRGIFLGALFTFALGILGYVAPILWLRSRTDQRRRSIANALPDFIDLLAISVEAGMGFDQAILRIVSKADNLLTLEFRVALRQMQLGASRREALRQMVDRTGVEDLSAFIGAILQAEQLGASVANVLRIQSEEMRVRRRQRAQRLAQQAPIKMLFPMAFLIFPPVFIVVLGPAIPHIIRAFNPGAPL